jgi:hypothetical protein
MRAAMGRKVRSTAAEAAVCIAEDVFSSSQRKPKMQLMSVLALKAEHFAGGTICAPGLTVQ